LNYLETKGPELLAKGYTTIPIRSGEKRPAINGWRTTKNVSREQISAWVAEGHTGVGVVLGDGVIALDADILDIAAAGVVRDQVARDLTALPVVRIGKAPKALYLFRTEEKFRKLMSKKYGHDGNVHALETLAVGQQCVMYGRHPSGTDYQWPDGEVPPLVDLPPITERQLREFILWWESQIPSDWEVVGPGNVDSAEPQPEPALDDTDLFERMKPPVDNIRPEEMRSQLEFIANHYPDAGGFTTWLRIGFACHHQTGGADIGEDLWDFYSSKLDNYDPREVADKYPTLDWRKMRTPVTWASVLKLYNELQGSIDVAAVADAQLGIEAEPEPEPLVEGVSDISDNPDSPQDKAWAYLETHGLTPTQLRAALAPVDWVVRDLVPSDTVGFLYGPPSSYKSFVAFDVALCVASGEAWHGNELCRPGGVMVIAGEGQGGLGRRWAAWEQVSGADLSGLPLVASRGAFYLDTPEGLQEATTLGRALEVAHGVDLQLLVIDTLARNTAGDENKAQDVAAIVKAADTLRDTFGCAVMLVHHSGKNLDNGMRGSSGLLGAADWVYLVNKVAENCCSVECQKTKDAKEPDERFFRSREIVIENTGHDEQIQSLVLDSINRADVPDPDAELGLPAGRELVVLRAVQGLAGDSEAEFGGLSKKAIVQGLIDLETFPEDGRRRARDTLRRLLGNGHLREEGEYVYVENWG